MKFSRLTLLCLSNVLIISPSLLLVDCSCNDDNGCKPKLTEEDKVIDLQIDFKKLYVASASAHYATNSVYRMVERVSQFLKDKKITCNSSDNDETPVEVGVAKEDTTKMHPTPISKPKYKVYPEQLTWKKAFDACQKKGYILAIVDDKPEETEELEKALKESNVKTAYIGSYLPYSYEFLDSSSYCIVVELYADGTKGRYNFRKCDDHLPFACRVD